MAKRARRFLCKECGGVHLKWSGKCPDCGAWDTLEEYITDAATIAALEGGDGTGAGGLGGSGDPWTVGGLAGITSAVPLSDVSTQELTRETTGIGELDRALGGGFVPGSAVLVGGDPGIGKSTLLLQAVSTVAARGRRTLYVSSEESAQQVKLRAERILTDETLKGAANPKASAAARDANLFLLSDTNLSRILEQARRTMPAVMVVDSIQLVHRADVDAVPGSVSQLRRSCLDLVQFAKATGTVVVIIGHVTKEGDLAGPRMLEHMVDCVLGFEGDRHHAYRVVRAVKNRFGSTHEIGLFEMTSTGLAEVIEGSFDGATELRPGVVVVPMLAGSRCLLAEVQSLAAAGFLGSAKRKSSGIDSGRLAMMIAVLEKHAGLRLGDQDIFASAGGGLRLNEPATDLAIGLAVAGAFLGRLMPAASTAIGEVALSGEVRPVRTIEVRLAEAARRGCKLAIIPKRMLSSTKAPKGMRLHGVATVYDAVQLLESPPK
ncbi:MAG: DNA repair protein RadA [Planctomycetota bacterium]|nr:DNA repair protein RadA [Planctomycetota bacterium]MDA1105852.1 DNA repair protein RadA [Planctomycetota bacterium]